MKTNGYARGTSARVALFSLECGRCGSSLISERHSFDLSLGEDFVLDSNGDYRRACGYCGARVNVPRSLLPFVT